MNFNVVGKIIKLWDELLYVKVNDDKDVLVERGVYKSSLTYGMSCHVSK